MSTTNELTELLTRFERQANRFGELWERCQGKGWPDAESDEFTKIRDERLPALRQQIIAERDALKAEAHNLNWALGAPGYDQMATPEEQAEADAAVARTTEFIDRLAENKAKHDAVVKDAERYRWLLANYARGDGYTAIDAALNDGEPDTQLSPAIDTAMAGA